MNENLLNEFIEEECTSYILSMLILELQEFIENDIAKLKEYTFNRFNLHLNSDENTIRIEDEFDVEESGVLIINLSDFLDILLKLYASRN